MFTNKSILRMLGGLVLYGVVIGVAIAAVVGLVVYGFINWI